MILGIDEVGRGPWAGPLVVGAVVLGGNMIEGLDDSKKLTKKRREILDVEIRAKAQDYALGWVSATELDAIGMSQALKLATRRAVEQIHVPYHEIIIDGTVNFLSGTTKGQYVTTVAKADGLIPSVSAASIVAKVARDAFMTTQDMVYPGYGFAKHAGYGVAAHREAIARLGVTPLHRLSFAPLAQYRQSDACVDVEAQDLNDGVQTTRDIGNQSESVVAQYLQAHGHRILERNWRTRWCEIDIVSRMGSTTYFTEVKHRKNDIAGDGFAAITSKKLRQMKFAAELYATTHSTEDLRLTVAATAGNPPRFVELVELREG